jgi:hypothetical protein
MKNTFVICQYRLPEEAGTFEVSLSASINPGDFTCLGIYPVNGEAQLLVLERQDVTRCDWTFVLVETGQIIPSDVRDYLGSFERNGKLLHLFGSRTRGGGGYSC